MADLRKDKVTRDTLNYLRDLLSSNQAMEIYLNYHGDDDAETLNPLVVPASEVLENLARSVGVTDTDDFDVSAWAWNVINNLVTLNIYRSTFSDQSGIRHLSEGELEYYVLGTTDGIQIDRSVQQRHDEVSPKVIDSPSPQITKPPKDTEYARRHRETQSPEPEEKSLRRKYKSLRRYYT